MICRHYLVSGRVQGVFFRATTQREAQALGLTGWVRNLSDGRVEVLACGTGEQLDTFEKWLEIGPEYAKVATIDSTTIEPPESVHGFRVLETARD